MLVLVTPTSWTYSRAPFFPYPTLFRPFYKDHFTSISRLRSLLPSARRRLDELPGPSHREGASESLRSGKGPVSAAGRAGCGGATPEPDFNKDLDFISKSRLRSLLPALGR